MKLVITGKPNIGKTAIAHIMQREFTEDLVVGPDVIDIMKSISIREPMSQYSQKCYQRALYHMQVELEKIIQDKCPKQMVLCDHGTLDCLSLWPDSPQSFFHEVHSSLDEELGRYDWVLQINGSEKRSKNPLTMRPPLDSQDFWSLHPRFLSVPSEEGFSFCYLETARVIKNILAGLSYEEILGNLLASSGKNKKPKFVSPEAKARNSELQLD